MKMCHCSFRLVPKYIEACSTIVISKWHSLGPEMSITQRSMTSGNEFDKLRRKLGQNKDRQRAKSWDALRAVEPVRKRLSCSECKHRLVCLIDPNALAVYEKA